MADPFDNKAATSQTPEGEPEGIADQIMGIQRQPIVDEGVPSPPPPSAGNTGVSAPPLVEEPGEGGTLPKNNDTQFQHWQSQYDTLIGGLNDVLGSLGMAEVKDVADLKDRLGNLQEIQQMTPIVRYIQSNPGILNAVDQSLSSSQTQGQPLPKENPEELLKKPVTPTKPATYDSTEAWSDPESASFKYREQIDAYRDEMMEYQDKRIETTQENLERDAQRRQVAIQQHMTESQLRDQFGYKDADVARFHNTIGYLQQKASLADFVKIDKVLNAPPETEAERIAKEQEMERQKQKLQTPQLGTENLGGGDVDTRSVGDRFMDGLIDRRRESNAFAEHK